MADYTAKKIGEMEAGFGGGFVSGLVLSSAVRAWIVRG